MAVLVVVVTALGVLGLAALGSTLVTDASFGFAAVVVAFGFAVSAFGLTSVFVLVFAAAVVDFLAETVTVADLSVVFFVAVVDVVVRGEGALILDFSFGFAAMAVVFVVEILGIPEAFGFVNFAAAGLTVVVEGAGASCKLT